MRFSCVTADGVPVVLSCEQERINLRIDSQPVATIGFRHGRTTEFKVEQEAYSMEEVNARLAWLRDLSRTAFPGQPIDPTFPFDLQKPTILTALNTLSTSRTVPLLRQLG